MCGVVWRFSARFDISKAATRDDLVKQQRDKQAVDPLEDCAKEQSNNSLRRRHFRTRSCVELLQVS